LAEVITQEKRPIFGWLHDLDKCSTALQIPKQNVKQLKLRQNLPKNHEKAPWRCPTTSTLILMAMPTTIPMVMTTLIPDLLISSKPPHQTINHQMIGRRAAFE
jgi:hypothetical protein